MSHIPRDPHFDSTLGFLRDPYRYVSRQCKRLGTELFETRFMVQKTICMIGRDCAQLIYDPARFRRRGAARAPMQKTLLGSSGVQTYDGRRHLDRKAMLLSILYPPERVAALASAIDHQWKRKVKIWERGGYIELYSEAREVIFRGVCSWAGIPFREDAFERHLSDVTALFDQAGKTGWGHIRARSARRRSQQWLARLVRDVRANRISVSNESAAHVISNYRDPTGEKLSTKTASVELLNILRPAVAISVYMVQAAVALHERPDCRERLRSEGRDYGHLFAQEVRRFFPFFPFIAARVNEEFVWKGYTFEKGTRALLDIYGTNHDPRSWEDPERFNPERFRNWYDDGFSFVPQGGGDPETGHRCPGERVTLELLERFIMLIALRVEYRVPEQQLGIDISQMPPLPESRFLIKDLRVVDRGESGAVSTNSTIP